MAQEPHKTSPTRARVQDPDPDRLRLAAVLLAEDGWTDQQIADYLGISRRTLSRWKNRADVALALEVATTLRSRRRWRESGHRYHPLWHVDGPNSPAPYE